MSNREKIHEAVKDYLAMNQNVYSLTEREQIRKAGDIIIKKFKDVSFDIVGIERHSRYFIEFQFVLENFINVNIDVNYEELTENPEDSVIINIASRKPLKTAAQIIDLLNKITV